MPSYLEKLQSMEFKDRHEELALGFLAGNVFDWGAKEVALLMEADKMDFVTMGHFDTANKAAMQAMKEAEIKAARLGLKLQRPFTPPSNQDVDIATMRSSYKEAVSALEASGLPIPERALLTKLPSEQAKRFLMEHFAYADIDKEYVKKYRRLILANYDTYLQPS